MLCAHLIIEFGPHRCNWQLSALNKVVVGNGGVTRRGYSGLNAANSHMHVVAW